MPRGTQAVGGHTLSRLIRGRREQLGLGVNELAQAAGLSGGWISRLERSDDPRVSDETALRLAQALDLDPLEVRVAAGLSSRDEMLTAGKRESFEAFIARDPNVTAVQRQALVALYRTFVPERGQTDDPPQ